MTDAPSLPALLERLNGVLDPFPPEVQAQWTHEARYTRLHAMLRDCRDMLTLLAGRAGVSK